MVCEEAEEGQTRRSNTTAEVTNRTVSNCGVLVITETWLNDNFPESAVQLEQITCYCADRALVNGGKKRGGGVMRGAGTLW